LKKFDDKDLFGVSHAMTVNEFQNHQQLTMSTSPENWDDHSKKEFLHQD